MTKKIFSLILCVVIAASVFAAVSVTAATDYKGAEITFTGPDGIVNGSPFKDLDFGSETAKRIEFTVYNTTSKTIEAMYLVYEWNFYKTRDNTYSPKIEAGGKATFTLTLPMQAEMNDGNVRSYKDINLRFIFVDGVPASGEKIVVTSNDQSVTDNLASCSGYYGIASIAGVNTLPNYKGAEITFTGPDGITKGSPFKDLDFGSETAKRIEFTVYNTTSKTIDAKHRTDRRCRRGAE